jgi:hypothetical protein
MTFSVDCIVYSHTLVCQSLSLYSIFYRVYLMRRKTNVAASEAGGITQKLSAFSVNMGDR